MDRNVATSAEKSDLKGTLQDQKIRKMSNMWWRQTVATVVGLITQL